MVIARESEQSCKGKGKGAREHEGNGRGDKNGAMERDERPDITK